MDHQALPWLLRRSLVGSWLVRLTPVDRNHIASHHVFLKSGDDILRQFWEIEQQPLCEPSLTLDEKIAVQHFKASHFRASDGRFMVPCLRSQAVRRFLHLEHSLHAKHQFADMVREYFDMGHAEPVPDLDQSVGCFIFQSMLSARKQARPRK